MVQSQDGRCGPTDLGHEGICSFFARHRCNSYCRDEWTRPRDRTAYFRADESTSMINRRSSGGGRKFDMAPPPPRAPLPTMYEDTYESSSDDDYY